MFTSKTKRIEGLAKMFPNTIIELEDIFNNPTSIYIDWSNVIHWQDKLGWSFHLKRAKQLFDSFDTIRSVKIYTGTLEGNQKSEDGILELKRFGYDVITKPVKLMKRSIDASSIPENSPALLQEFIKKPLLELFDIATIIFLNKKLQDINKKGQKYIEDKKCNFDVEMGRDMLRDFDTNNIENYCIWTVDSDFADPVQQITKDGKRVIIFATSGKVSPELDATGVHIFDVKKIREFVCWSRELEQSIKDKVDV